MALAVAFFMVAPFILLALFLIFTILLIYHLLSAIPYFKMAHNAGYKHAWVSFLPLGYNYIGMVLPHRVFNIGIIRTEKRKNIFWIWLGMLAFLYIGIQITSLIFTFAFGEFPFSPDMSEEAFRSVSIIYNIIIIVVYLTMFLINAVIKCRMHYDILKTYEMDKHALWISLVSTICPLVMMVVAFIIMNREPEYGIEECYI